MPTAFEVNLRHSSHFCDVLNEMGTQYFRNISDFRDICLLVDKKWGQIQKGREWAYEYIDRDEQAQTLCINYAMKWPEFLSRFLHPKDYLFWLEDAKKAIVAIEQKNKITSEGHLVGFPSEVIHTHIGILMNISAQHRKLFEQGLALENLLEADQLSKQIDDRNQRAQLLNNMAMLYCDVKIYKKAKYLLEKAYNISRKPGSELQLGNVYLSQGALYSHLEKYDKAEELFTLALNIFTEIKDINGIRKSKGNLAQLHDRSDHKVSASQELEEYIKASQEVGDRASEARGLIAFARSQYNQGNYELCLEYLKKALVLSRASGDRREEGEILFLTCLTYFNLDEIDEAMNFGRDAYIVLFSPDLLKSVEEEISELNKWIEYKLTIEEQIKWWESILDEYNARGITARKYNIFYKLGALQADLHHAEQAHRLFLSALENLDDFDFEAIPFRVTCLTSLGVASIALNLIDEAIKYLDQAKIPAKTFRLEEQYIQVVYWLGIAYEKKSLFDEAKKVYLEALKLCAKKNDSNMMCDCYHQLGNLCLLRHESTEAYQWFMRAFSLNKKENDVLGQCIALMKMGEVLVADNDIPGAIKLAEEAIRLSDITNEVNFRSEALSALDEWKSKLLNSKY